MRFKIDENLPGELAADLRQAGHEADTVSDQGMSGAADDSCGDGGVGPTRVFLETNATLSADPGNVPGVGRFAKNQITATVTRPRVVAKPMAG